MSDRAHMHMTIGGQLLSIRIPTLVELALEYHCSPEWDGEPITEADIVPGKPLELMAMEIPGGMADKLEAFCRENLLPYSRWSGACWGAFNAEIDYYEGKGEIANFAADDDARPMMQIDQLAKFETIDELKAAIAPAAFVVPPLTII